MKKSLQFLLVFFVIAAISVFETFAADSLKVLPKMTMIADANNAGLKLPSGFVAIAFAENTGRARHIAVTIQGTVYIKLGRLINGNGILRLKDLDGDGKADDSLHFGNYVGTGIAIKNDYLYTSSDDDVFRYKLDTKGDVINPEQPEKIVTGLLNRRQHASKSLTLDNAGNIYVNIGAYTNSCQEKAGTPGSMGKMPCNILDSAGGIWQFKADKLNQTYGDGIRFATGLRNVVGLDWNIELNQLFVLQHGRDDLHNLFPGIYTEQQNADLPAETMYAINKGDDAGFPYIYYDPFTNKKMVAPEYGGDGKKEGGENAINPTMAFPAHMAPNGLLFYRGNQFPAKYKNGAFIAFHGSWNRTPLPQEGYYVAFVPYVNGKPSGKWEVFANGFAGIEVINSTRSAIHRPCGLAEGTDGSLYVTDDQKGTIYRIFYNSK